MFVAVYWWRVHPGKEDQFRKAWRRGTELIRQLHGSYGSRLHRDANGRFVGYAEWPDEATWRAAFDQKMVYDDPETRAAFVDAVAEVPADADPIFTMTVTDNLLLRGEQMAAPFRLDGKIALVTGSGQGLGLEIAHGLARSGARVRGCWSMAATGCGSMPQSPRYGTRGCLPKPSLQTSWTKMICAAGSLS